MAKGLNMRRSRNFHERGSNENGNFWSRTRGGPAPQISQNYLFLGKIFKFQGGSGPPVPPSGSAHVEVLNVESSTIHVAKTKVLISFAVTVKLNCTFVFAYVKCFLMTWLIFLNLRILRKIAEIGKYESPS